MVVAKPQPEPATMTQPRTTLPPSSAIDLAVSALARQGRYGAVSALADEHGVSRREDRQDKLAFASPAFCWGRRDGGIRTFGLGLRQHDVALGLKLRPREKALSMKCC